MTETADNPFDPSANIPFLGYRRFSPDERPVFELCSSLLHFYESEKFRGTDETIRQAVLDASTRKEVQKIAKKNKDKWRPDWTSIRADVFRSGLSMQAFHSRKAMAAARAGFNALSDISGKASVGGLPGKFVAEQLRRYFQATSGPGATRLGVIALRGCVPQDIEDRLAALFPNTRPLSAAIYAGGDADHCIEMWCAKNCIPVRLTSETSKRLREEDATAVTARISSLLACMPMNRRAPQAIVERASQRSPKIMLLDFSIASIEAKRTRAIPKKIDGSIRTMNARSRAVAQPVQPYE